VTFDSLNLIDSLNAIFYALTFVVPGFLVHSTLSIFLTRRAEHVALSLPRFLTLSAFNYAVWSPLIYLLIRSEWLAVRPVLSAVLWTVIILFGPVLLGFGLGYASQKEWPRRVLQRLGLQPVHVMPTTWDLQFGRMNEPHWVLVTMKDGSQVAGYFGGRSCASSDPPWGDLYIEQVMSVPAKGRWRMGPKGTSILISGGEIRYIEFWPVKREQEQTDGK